MGKEATRTGDDGWISRGYRSGPWSGAVRIKRRMCVSKGDEKFGWEKEKGSIERPLL